MKLKMKPKFMLTIAISITDFIVAMEKEIRNSLESNTNKSRNTMAF